MRGVTADSYRSTTPFNFGLGRQQARVTSPPPPSSCEASSGRACKTYPSRLLYKPLPHSAQPEPEPPPNQATTSKVQIATFVHKYTYPHNGMMMITAKPAAAAAARGAAQQQQQRSALTMSVVAPRHLAFAGGCNRRTGVAANAIPDPKDRSEVLALCPLLLLRTRSSHPPNPLNPPASTNRSSSHYQGSIKDVSDISKPSDLTAIRTAPAFTAAPLVPTFSRRREIWAGRLAMVGFAAACAWAVGWFALGGWFVLGVGLCWGLGARGMRLVVGTAG